MIKIEFLNSPDESVIGEYLTFKDRLLIGTSKYNDIVIDDSNLNAVHFFVKLNRTALLCGNNQSIDHYHSNGKKISGKKSHKKNDVISIGKTEFKILDFEFEVQHEYKDQLKENYTLAIQENPEYKHLLTNIQNELVKLESNE
jgi:hypothetical protein